MSRSYLDTPVPIVALATAPGESALAVIRTSGEGSVELVASVFSRPRLLRAAPGRSGVHGELLDPATGKSVDEVIATVFRAPKSPSGEDQVEISCHGSGAVIRKALALLESAGFAPALPGEFSFRAFVNGKTDLVRAEAVNELVRARSDTARADALSRLEGGLSRRLGAARAALLELMAEAELRLDYGEDEIEGELPSVGIETLRAGLAALAGSYSSGRLLAEGLRVALAGSPNVGKSSLFNLFLREERSIVSPEAGTTRDWIEAEIELGGARLRLVDTAGLRKADAAIEAEGVARSERVIEEADIVLYLVDAREGLSPADAAFMSAHPLAIGVCNKTDLAPGIAPPSGYLGVSAATGEGFAGLAAALEKAASARLFFNDGGDSPAASCRVASERQKLLLDRALAAVDASLRDLAGGVGYDLVALDLREAADALGEITGELATPEILEAIFSRFCVGK
jgi:tRNA modification GTPase